MTTATESISQTPIGALTLNELQRFDLLEHEDGNQRVYLGRGTHEKEPCVFYRTHHPMRAQRRATVERWNVWLEGARLVRRLPREFQ